MVRPRTTAEAWASPRRWRRAVTTVASAFSARVEAAGFTVLKVAATSVAPVDEPD
jgi:hypothetical protein